ncbi:MAG: hypothetical protein K2X76_12945 [Sphingomonas sp.]|nr:hypothetical protein [Sphingomonas sp.]
MMEAMMEAAMARGEPGPGERAERARRRRVAWLMGALALAGGVIGFTAARLERGGIEGNFNVLQIGALPPWFAILATLTFVGAVGIGSWFYWRGMDEVARRDHYRGAVWALNVYLLLYPSWFLLWRGGLVSEPSHRALFLITVATSMIVYLWSKWRN